MSASRDIPGTTIFDSRQARKGYALNKMCYSFNDAANRAAFQADEDGYCAKYGLNPQQREAIRAVPPSIREGSMALGATRLQTVRRQVLPAAIPGIAEFIHALKDRGHGLLAIRRLARMMREYPRAAFADAITTAAHYGLYDLHRVENMVLRNVGKDFFPRVLGDADDKDTDDDDDR